MTFFAVFSRFDPLFLNIGAPQNPLVIRRFSVISRFCQLTNHTIKKYKEKLLFTGLRNNLHHVNVEKSMLNYKQNKIKNYMVLIKRNDKKATSLLTMV